MRRKNFILSALITLPFLAFSKLKIFMRTGKGFKISAGEARFGKHFKMKGVTVNIMDTKISGKDTDNDLVVFEQTGLTLKGGPPLHIHPNQDEWFYIIEGDYLFQVGEDKHSLNLATLFSCQEVFLTLSFSSLKKEK